MHKFDFKKWAPVILAAGCALIFAVWYLASGRSSLDENVRKLEQSSTVEGVTASTEENTLLVKCKNGESYKIKFKPGQTEFNNLVYNNCGELGIASTSQQ